MSSGPVFSWKSEILDAAVRVHPYVRHTLLDHSSVLSERYSCNVHIKLESEQVTGSFKARGAFNKLLKLKEHGILQPNTRPICASTGNHALACNHAMKCLGISGQTFVPATIKPVKESILRNVGADLVKCGDDCVEGELAARKSAEEEGRPYISPYNDLDVAAGQGTIGIEILADLPDVDVVFVPVGGGGMIGGIAAYLKAVNPSIKIVGCQPANSKVMYESVKAGKIIFEESQPTLSDGTAGGLEEGTVTFDLCRDLVDEWVMVEEDMIIEAVYFMVEHQHKIVEGATGVSVGAFMMTAANYKDKNVVIIACGSNIGVDTLKQILNSK